MRREKWPKKSWEEGEIGRKSREEGEIGSESREKGDLLPCSSPLRKLYSMRALILLLYILQ